MGLRVGNDVGSVAMAVLAAGFSASILVVFGHVAVDAAVVDADAGQAHRAGELGVLVYLHVVLRQVLFIDAFVFHLAHTEEGEFAQGVITMQRATKEVVGVAEHKALMAAAGQGGGDFQLHGGGEDLIGV